MYTTNLHDDYEKRTNMCVANSDVQKNSTVSNEDGVEIFIGRISGFLRTAYRERFTANQWYRWNVYALQRSAFWRSRPISCHQPQKKQKWVPAFTSSISSHIKHFAEFSGDNIFQTRAKIVEKSPKVFCSMCFRRQCSGVIRTEAHVICLCTLNEHVRCQFVTIPFTIVSGVCCLAMEIYDWNFHFFLLVILWSVCLLVTVSL